MENKLFSVAPDWYHNAIVHHLYPHTNKWNAYTEGYKLAAKVLSEKVLNEMNNRDTLIFPILFLYRHYLELKLKEILEQGSIFLDESCEIPQNHNIMALWADTRKIILNIWPDTALKTVKGIEAILMDIHNVDRGSDAFRYPIKKSGDFTLDGYKMINLRNFISLIEPIIEDLEGMSLGIEAYKDHKDEMMREYRPTLSDYY